MLFDREAFDYVVVGILGMVVGSFLNVVVHRVPRHESVIHPASHCPHCGHVLHSWENIPVLSWMLLRGRCHGCGKLKFWRMGKSILFVWSCLIARRP